MSETTSGFSFPFRLNQAGSVAGADGPDKLRENIVQLLLTNVGERVMRREYGGGLHQLVHDPNNDVLRAIVQHQIAKAIGEWEPRVQIQGVTISREVRQGEIFVEIRYIIRNTKQVQSLSVPIGLGGI